MEDKIIDIEEINKKYDDHIAIKYPKPSLADVIKYNPILDRLLNNEKLLNLKKEYNFGHKNSFLFQILLIEKIKYTTTQFNIIRDKLKIKNCKSESGILSVTVFTAPYPEYIDENGNYIVQSFSCEWNCAYCPNEPGQPRSYLRGEPGVLRANRENFNCIKQMYIRLEALYLTGHDLDKLEILVLGGTWTSYPIMYREQFIRDIYYAANTYIYNHELIDIRKPLSLTQEKEINKTANCKIIGLTLETRPDTINYQELHLLRYYGCTRIQLGIQHIDNYILRKINRDCSTFETIRSIELLKNCGYKIDAHWMPNLPFSNPEKDDQMLNYDLLGVESKKYSEFKDEIWEEWNLKKPELQVDQWKIYQCTIVPFTKIKEWYENGTYIPYSNKILFDILIKMKSLIFPWIRLNRLVRDIPSDYVPQTDYHSNMRQQLMKALEKDGWYCSCIRCREVKSGNYDTNNSITVIRKYNASNGYEYFISRESRDKKTIYGFVRLRITNYQASHIFPELQGCALIRELHVYGNLQIVGNKNNNATQHSGIGKMLMNKAEQIAIKNGYKKMSVIAGEGTRGYYEKLNYINDPGEGHFMIKTLV
jgi:ELP3 family radical SAM enzyme/protein acetyltransferase